MLSNLGIVHRNIGLESHRELIKCQMLILKHMTGLHAHLERFYGAGRCVSGLCRAMATSWYKPRKLTLYTNHYALAEQMQRYASSAMTLVWGHAAIERAMHSDRLSSCLALPLSEQNAAYMHSCYAHSM